MKHIRVPENVVLKDLVTRESTGVEYSFFRWLQEIVLMDYRFAVDWKTNRSAMAVADAFFEKKPGAWVSLESADYDLVKQSVEEPQRRDRVSGQIIKGYEQPALYQQVGPYVQAVQKAIDKLTEEG